MKKGCMISGGGARGAYGGGTLARIDGDYDTIVGISTGGLLAPFAALKEWDILKEAYTSVGLYDIIDKCWYKGKPFNNDGSSRLFPILTTLLFQQKSVYTSNSLRHTIDSFFTADSFEDLITQNKEVLVGTQNFAEIPSKIHYFSSMVEEFEDFKDWMWCSANYPHFSSLVKKGWTDESGGFHVGEWSDGGLTDLVGFDQMIGQGYDEVDIILHQTKFNEKFEGNKIRNLIDNVGTSVSAVQYSNEFKNFYYNIRRLNKAGAKVRVFWLPRQLSKHSMMFNKDLMSKWWDEGYETAFDTNRVEIFEPIVRAF